jgi:hypothetical protein
MMTIDITALTYVSILVNLRNHLDLLRQTANYLMVLTNAEVFRPSNPLDSMFPKLLPEQLMQIMERYEPDKMAPDPIPDTVRLRIELNVINDASRLAVVPQLLDAENLVHL